MKSIKKVSVIAILSAIFFSVQLHAQQSGQAIHSVSGSTDYVISVTIKMVDPNNQIIQVASAEKSNAAVQLTWQETKSKDISHYVIQRSADGEDFIDAGIIMTNDNDSVALSNYYFIDKVIAVANEKVFYRVKQVLTNGDYGFIHAGASQKFKKPASDLVVINNQK